MLVLCVDNVIQLTRFGYYKFLIDLNIMEKFSQTSDCDSFYQKKKNLILTTAFNMYKKCFLVYKMYALGKGKVNKKII